MKTVIVDYGAGNLTSVRNAFASLGVETEVSADAQAIGAADRVVFPGVGAAKSAMANLTDRGLVEPVLKAIGSGRPFLGICLGMQILFEHSEEDGGVDLLGAFKGRVRRFPDAPGFKVPEIGWNQVAACEGAAGFADGDEFYFVHSYCADVGSETVGVTNYAGIDFTAMARRGSVWACQFHPEKSGRVGLNLLKEWLSC